MSELARMLLMIQLIAKNDMSTEDLEKILSVTRRTLTRYIAEARSMGADLASARTSAGHYVWTCYNWNEINTRVNTWYDLEKSRDLLTAENFSLEN